MEFEVIKVALEAVFSDDFKKIIRNMQDDTIAHKKTILTHVETDILLNTLNDVMGNMNNMSEAFKRLIDAGVLQQNEHVVTAPKSEIRH